MPSFSSNIPQPSQALLSACEDHKITPHAQAFSASSAVPLMLFEAGQRPNNALNAQSATSLLDNLRRGGSFLFTLGIHPGQSPFWLSQALPSTGWTSQRQPPSYDPQTPTPILVSDADFFKGANLDGLAAPLGFDIRPVSAVERGQSRYERYRIQHPILGTDMAPNSDLWSRPLLNREWTVRACYNTIERLPLLVTSRYGAGKVAMLATTSAALGESPAAQAFWRAVIGWLNEANTRGGSIPDIKPSLAMSFPSANTVRLTMNNPSHTPLPVQLVMRTLDRDGAMLGDGAGEFVKPVTLPAGRSTVLDLPLLPPALPGIEANEAETSLQVRAGLLTDDGSTLLAEQRATSLPPALRLHIATENLYTAPFPFSGPGTDALIGFQGRMGTATCSYAYLPGNNVRGTLTLRHQCENLAPYAKVEDLTQPGNVSVVALNDRGAAIRRTPIDHIQGYGTWNGKPGVENVLQFTFSEPSRLSAITLVGSCESYGNFALHNPGQLAIEIDDKPGTAIADLDSAFTKGLGQVRIALPPGTTGSRVKVRLPWVPEVGNRQRQEPWLGEVEIEGWPATISSANHESGRLTVELVEALSGHRQPVLEQAVTLYSNEIHLQDFTVELPQSTKPEIYRLEGIFQPDDAQNRVIATAPILAISPRKTLRSIQEITGPNIFGTGMLVTNGFTQFFQLATGTSEPWNGWGHPDDLVWAYSRQFKEIPPKARTAANRLYATQSDMRHYSMPWREFSNGEPFFQTSVPGLIQHLKQQNGWNKSKLLRLNFSDRWVTGPDLNVCNGWQEYVAFDSYLHTKMGKGLDGRTHGEVELSIHTDHENEWQAWQLDRYVGAVRAIRTAFQAEEKDAVIYSQGMPMVAGPLGRELAQTIRGMNDDFTWSMEENSSNLTTGRTLGTLAFNPVWQMNTLQPWGFVSSIFNNWQWHDPVGTTEPMRRSIYNRIGRGMVWDGGSYRAAATYGYGDNVGSPYTITREEYQQWWYLQQRGSLLQPESPLGTGLVISTQKNANPQSIRWNGIDPTALPETRLMMDAFRSLTEAGISIPFATNASTLAEWKPTPEASLIILNLQDFSPEEFQALARIQEQGIRLAAFASRNTLSPRAVSLFSRPGTLLLETSAAGLTHAQALELAGQIIKALELPIGFSTGFAGYGFRCQNLNLIVVEDWLEETREAKIQLRKSPGARQASASNLNDHSTLAVADTGAFWEIVLPMRSGDGALLAVREL